MKKKFLMMAGAFMASAAAVTGIRHYLVKKEKERLASWDEDCEEDEEDIDDFGFDEDLDLDFEFEKDDEERAKEYEQTLEELVKSVAENRLLFKEDQVKKLQNALNRRADELRLINSLYGEVGANE